MTTDAYPLVWPEGWPRTPDHQRQDGGARFRKGDWNGGYKQPSMHSACERFVPAALHFLSCEPLLGPVDLEKLSPGRDHHNALSGGATIYDPDYEGQPDKHAYFDMFGGPKIELVISGGESGPGSRPAHPDWHRSLRDQCAGYGATFFFKQWGDWIDADQYDCLDDPILRDFGKVARHRSHRLRPMDGTTMIRVGKANAGALLDGRAYHSLPEAV